MAPENQDRIRAWVDRHGTENLIVVLGTADPDALAVAAETVTAGDPSFVGPLAGVQLGLPVVHILEEEIKGQIDADTYRRHVGLVELAVDVDAVRAAMRRYRSGV